MGFFESGLGWIPYWLERLDEYFEVMGHHTPWLKRRPSEIFREQCFVSMEADEVSGLRWMMEMDLTHCILSSQRKFLPRHFDDLDFYWYLDRLWGR